MTGTATAAFLGLVAGGLAIRRHGIYFAMITLALAPKSNSVPSIRCAVGRPPLQEGNYAWMPIKKKLLPPH